MTQKPFRPSSYDDDIDDIMASIMNGANSSPSASPEQSAPKHVHTPQRPVERHDAQSEPSPAPVFKPAAKQPQQKSLPKINKKLIAAPLAGLIIVAGAFFIWNGPLAAVLKPQSPFSEEVLGAMTSTPLYYPTKLPGSYKLELNSITQPESSVVVYAITDDEGKKINVSLQAQPKNMTLEPLHKALTDLRKTETKFGTITTGTSEDGIDISNILTGQTWVIITSQKGVLSSDELKLIVNSLEV